MMNSRYLIDDQVLVALLEKTDPSKLAWKVTFQKFKRAFNNYFRVNHDVNSVLLQEIYPEIFTKLVATIGKSPNKLTQPIFSSLIELGYKKLNCPQSKNQKNKVAPYLAGEILVQLIQANHPQCLYYLFSQYKESTMLILNNKYGSYFSVSPQEIYGEAIMAMKKNIEQGKLEFPMRSRLFTYFILIARNKYLALGNKMKGLVFYPDLMAFETKLNPKDSKDYYNIKNESLCPILKRVMEHPSKEAFKKLLDTFHIDEHELLRLRFEEGLRFKEIGKLMHLKEATCRKRLHDSIKRWKKQFFIGQVA